MRCDMSLYMCTFRCGSVNRKPNVGMGTVRSVIRVLGDHHEWKLTFFESLNSEISWGLRPICRHSVQNSYSFTVPYGFCVTTVQRHGFFCIHMILCLSSVQCCAPVGQTLYQPKNLGRFVFREGRTRSLRFTREEELILFRVFKTRQYANKFTISVTI